jgi:hypothetical protein
MRAYPATVGKRAVGALVAGFVALGACATSHASSPTTPPTAVGAPTSTSRATSVTRKPATTRVTAHTATTARTVPTHPTPAFSFDDSVPPPKLVDTGTDYVAVLNSFHLYGDWLAAHRPDPALIPNLLVPGRTFDDFASNLAWYRANGRRAIDLLRGSIDVTVVSARPDAFSARVVEDITAHQELDAHGTVTAEVRYPAPTTYIILVVRVSDKWRIASEAIKQSVDVHL